VKYFVYAGNFNYGATGRAAGFSQQELKRSAGAYQKYGEAIGDILNGKIPDSLTGSTYKPEFGDPTDIDLPLFSPGTSYGDDPVDQKYIQEGINWYDENFEK
jgi:hypothetical protein